MFLRPFDAFQFGFLCGFDLGLHYKDLAALLTRQRCYVASERHFRVDPARIVGLLCFQGTQQAGYYHKHQTGSLQSALLKNVQLEKNKSFPGCSTSATVTDLSTDRCCVPPSPLALIWC